MLISGNAATRTGDEREFVQQEGGIKDLLIHVVPLKRTLRLQLVHLLHAQAQAIGKDRQGVVAER